MARPWVDYIARSSFLLQQGRNVADVAYFYGEEAPLAGTVRGWAAGGSRRVRYAYRFRRTADAVFGALRVEWMTETRDTGGARYQGCSISAAAASAMTLPTLRRYERNRSEAGATVVGQPPRGIAQS